MIRLATSLFALMAIFLISAAAEAQQAIVVGLNYDWDRYNAAAPGENMSLLDKMLENGRIDQDAYDRFKSVGVRKKEKKETLKTLNLAVADAIAVAELLVKFGYNVELWHDSPSGTQAAPTIYSRGQHVRVPDPDRVKQNVFPDRLSLARRIGNSESSKGIFLFYFAGHGELVEGRDALILLDTELPLDQAPPPEKVRSLEEKRENQQKTQISEEELQQLDEELLKQTGLSNLLIKRQENTRLAVLDSCRTGTGFGVQSIQPSEDVWYLNAAAALTTASETSGSDHGMFTGHFLRGMEGYADLRVPSGRNGRVTLDELYDYVRIKMPAKQSPKLTEPSTRGLQRHEIEVADYYRVDLVGKHPESEHWLKFLEHWNLTKFDASQSFDAVNLSGAKLDIAKIPLDRLKEYQIEVSEGPSPNVPANSVRGKPLLHVETQAGKASKLVLRNVSFRGAELQNCELTGWHFQGCDLTGIDLNDAILKNVEIEKDTVAIGANLNAQSLTNVKGSPQATGAKVDRWKKLQEQDRIARQPGSKL